MIKTLRIRNKVKQNMKKAQATPPQVSSNTAVPRTPRTG